MRVLRVLAAVVVLALAGCGGGTPTPGATTGGHAPITVFAAASLTGVFDEIGASVSRETGTEVRFEYAGSSDLAAQLAAGAPGDVFASAGEKPMADAVAGGAAGAPTVFATNTLTIVTPPADPGHVGALADLARPDVRTVVCAPQVPCGEATRRLFSAESLTVTPVSEEPKVADVLGKVASGQADAGLVYVTDAARAGHTVRVVPTPQAEGIRNSYPIAVTRHAGDDPARAATAEAFVRAVLGDEGRATLTRAGFGVPKR